MVIRCKNHVINVELVLRGLGFMDETLSISDVSVLLKITEKTVRNYIKKGFFKPEKWNGMWRISKFEVLEIYKKKNGNKGLLEKVSVAPNIEMPKSEYFDHMIELGKLKAYETLLKEQKEELLKATDRMIQLEASSASGWTEARFAQSRCELLEKELDQMQKQQRDVSEELVWVRRENERVMGQLEEQLELNRKMHLKIKSLEDQLHASSLYV